MEKMITLRFASKCKTCNVVIPSGDRAIWLGHKQGVRHEACKPIEAPIKKPEMKVADRTVTFDFNEIVSAFADWQIDPAKVITHSENLRAARSHSDGLMRGAWHGCSLHEMNEWISSGYHVPGLSEVSSLIPTKPRRKLVFGEEGDELLLELAYAGSDEPYVSWEKRSAKPGLSIEIGMVFNAAIPAETISQYQRWIARMLQTFDENHVDMEVVLSIGENGADSYQKNRITDTRIRVKKAGEASDFSAWSAMFSPGGFRMLGIMAIGLHVDREHLGTLSSGYGMPVPHGDWDVLYDEERNVLKIGEANWGSFPEFEMTQKLTAVLEKLTSR